MVLAEYLGYTEATDYMTLPSGDYTVEIRAAEGNESGTVLGTIDVSVDAGTAHTAWALGNVPENGTAIPPTFRVQTTADASKTIEFPDGTPGTPGAPATGTPGENGTETPGENVTDTVYCRCLPVIVATG